MSKGRARSSRYLDVKVVILAGGEGTRLRPLTLTRPKSMLPLGHRPVIEHLITHVSGLGFKRFIITVNYLREQLMNYIGDGSRFNVKVDYAVEPEGMFLGTAGSLKLATHMLDKTFVVIQGDTYTTMNLKKALEFHMRKGADATIVLKEVQDPWNYGVAVIDDEGRIRAFQEKPMRGKEKGRLVSTGIYILEPEILDFVTPRGCDFARDVFPKLLELGREIYGFVGDGYWVDVGSLEGYLEGTKMMLDLLAKSEKGRPKVIVGEGVEIDEEASVKAPALIEDGASISARAEVGPYAVIKEGSKVAEGAVIRNAAIFEGASIGRSSSVKGSVVGERAKIGERVVVEGSVIGPGSKLERGVRVRGGGRVWPGITIEACRIVEGNVSLPTSNPFLFRSGAGKYIGVTASTIDELAETLRTVDLDSIQFHLRRRDFEKWIRLTFGANLLAEEIAKIRKDDVKGEELREKLIKTINDWLIYSTERSVV